MKRFVLITVYSKAITFLQPFLVTYSYVVFGPLILFLELRVQPISLPRSKADFTSAQPFFLTVISENEDFTADTEAALDKAVDEFRSTFVSSNGKPLVEKKPDVAKAAPVDQEKIVAGEK